MDPKIVISDQSVLDAVRSVTQRAELYDPAGRQVGVVLSPQQYEQMRQEAGEIEPTPEFLEQVRQDVAAGRTKSTHEVLAMLARIERALSGEA
jgi:hypothetical protein